MGKKFLKRVVADTLGFTLLEILVVVAIIGVLAAFVGPSVFQNISRSRQTAVVNQIAMFASALENYRLDVGRYPTTEQGLQALTNKPTLPPIPQNWNGPYLLSEPPLDPWGQPYNYRYPGERNPGSYDLFTLGADGQIGGEGENRDIGNWN
ncbi:MAG: type II secretion system major pseudopilin GspG [Firmicutes bacterium]|nr:type II secretion system major pseudopilin GspG [Bacillota bacterium]